MWTEKSAGIIYQFHKFLRDLKTLTWKYLKFSLWFYIKYCILNLLANKVAKKTPKADLDLCSSEAEPPQMLSPVASWQLKNMCNFEYKC